MDIFVGLFFLCLFVIAVMAMKWPKVITISDDVPESNTPKNRWMKLQNEGSKYVKVEDGKVTLKVVK